MVEENRPVTYHFIEHQISKVAGRRVRQGAELLAKQDPMMASLLFDIARTLEERWTYWPK